MKKGGHFLTKIFLAFKVNIRTSLTGEPCYYATSTILYVDAAKRLPKKLNMLVIMS